MLSEGTHTMKEISLTHAESWVAENDPTNFSGHQTVKLVGVVPATSREQCEGYDTALVLKPNSRLEFGKEYTLPEIQEIGVTAYLITFTVD